MPRSWSAQCVKLHSLQAKCIIIFASLDTIHGRVAKMVRGLPLQPTDFAILLPRITTWKIQHFTNQKKSSQQYPALPLTTTCSVAKDVVMLFEQEVEFSSTNVRIAEAMNFSKAQLKHSIPHQSKNSLLWQFNRPLLQRIHLTLSYYSQSSFHPTHMKTSQWEHPPTQQTWTSFWSLRTGWVWSRGLQAPNFLPLQEAHYLTFGRGSRKH